MSTETKTEQEEEVQQLRERVKELERKEQARTALRKAHAEVDLLVPHVLEIMSDEISAEQAVAHLQGDPALAPGFTRQRSRQDNGQELKTREQKLAFIREHGLQAWLDRLGGP